MDENEEQDAYDDTVTEYAASLDENCGYGCFILLYSVGFFALLSGE